MKKYLSFLVMGLIAVLPFGVKAAAKIGVSCEAVDSNGYKTCVLAAEITNEDSLVVTLTEKGGANITNVKSVNDDWTITDQDEVDGVWTIKLTGLGSEGEVDLFSFTYLVSGEKDCEIVASFGSQKVSTESNTDTTTPQKQTGSSLPYVALGAMALIAGGAYVATKNKAKMYRL